MKIKTIIFLTLLISVTVQSQDADKKFRIYGFSDMSVVQRFLPDNSLFRTVSDQDFRISLDHANLYFDMTPNSKTRFLTELSFQSNPVEAQETVGRKIIVDVYGLGITETNDTDPSAAYSNSITSPGSGEILEWGSFSMERAWFEYQMNQYFNLRFGKFITPAGIWNVDHGSPVITTINQPYETGLMAIFPESQLGIMNQGTGFLGDVDLDYALYVSTGRGGFEVKSARDVAVGGNIGALFPLFDGIEIGASAFTGTQKASLTTQVIKVTVDSAMVTSMTMETMMELGIFNPFDPTVLMALQEKIGAYVSKEAVNPDNHTYAKEYEYKSREYAVGGDLKISIGNLTLQSEVNHQALRNLNDNDAKSTQTGFYGLLSYGIPVAKQLKLTPYIMFERIISMDAESNPQMYLANTGVEGFQVVTGGLNLKVLTNLTFKLEYGYADILTKDDLKPYKDAMDFSTVKGQFSLAF